MVVPTFTSNPPLELTASVWLVPVTLTQLLVAAVDPVQSFSLLTLPLASMVTMP